MPFVNASTVKRIEIAPSDRNVHSNDGSEATNR